jgi:serine phosphatase RsbU (regulator of sigma subunit)
MKKVTLFAFILFFLVAVPAVIPAQTNSISSLQNLAQSLNNDTTRIETLVALSKQYQDTEPERAFTYGLQALVLSTQINFPRGMAYAHNNLGDLYWYKNDYLSSGDHYHEALKIFEELKDLAAIADCYRNIGWIYFSTDKTHEALEYHTKALQINREFGALKSTASNYNDIGICYHKLAIYDSAMQNYCKSLNIMELGNIKTGLAGAYGNIGDLFNDMGNNWEAINNLLQSLKLSEEIGNKRYMSDTYGVLSNLYLKDSNYTAAIEALDKATVFATELNDKSLLKKNYEKFASLYALQYKFQKADEYINLASELTDSILEDANKRQQAEMVAKYEFASKREALTKLIEGKKLFAEMISREKTLKIYLLVFCLIVVLFALFLYRNNAQKHKMNLALEKASHEIEEKNKSITDSILYSKHIQDVCLPSKQLKDQLFGQIFILFQPKDIVSGDFYWYNEKNGKKLIAACDCTGHGVPGALMSMIGNNILNRIVNEKGLTSPEEVLNRLNYEIRKTLKQEEQSESKDGMDIALLTFNSDTEVEYAGANRPLWVVRHSKSSQSAGAEADSAFKPELEEIKPDKFSIGGHPTETPRQFKKHIINVSKGDCLYLFSDGFGDQFGGSNGKRFTTKRFKELLVMNAAKPVEEQELVLKSVIKEWKGELEQIDDILVIGIKIG